MGIEPTFGKGLIAQRVAAFRDRLDRAVEFRLKYLGEELAKYAKDNHTYTDQTGNLTNSIGYAVVRGTRIVHYGGIDQPGEGAQTALAVLQEYAESLTHTYSLIVVAGMNYAAYVESKGYNVILPAELRAKTEFPRVMAKLQKAAKAKAAELFGNDVI